MLLHYCGNELKCNNCEENDLGVLTIDHINGGGGKHRKELFGNKRRGGYALYQWLKRSEYPNEFQVLCFSCQFRKRQIEMRPINPTHRQLVVADYVRKLKIECLDHYGGCKCPCGEDDITTLTLDHANNDGAKHREQTGTRGNNFYHMLRKNNFPNEPPLQVLCLNCNIKKRNKKYEQDRGKNNKV